ncbi:MAG: dihydropyrimidinase [Chloroflexi bacterium]|nr:dihydropyrimidinase [Chloroflexota bacterium]MCL5107264.1 dihydropyrimidinase [Chloroflexota bacterium]
MRVLVKGGTIVTAADTYVADVLVVDEKVQAIGQNLQAEAERVIDAKGKYVLPGAIDVHTHLDMPFGGTVSADDFLTGTRAAAMGGTTAVVDFAIQSKGKSLRDAFDTWQEKARGKACVDYGLHVAITDLPDPVLAEMPELVEAGVSSFKLFLAYKGSLMVDDATFFKALRKARESGALISFHGENGDVIDVLVKQMVAAGQVTPRYHALSRPPEAEAEATARAIALAEMAEAPIYVVHLSAALALDKVAAARDRGLPVYAETCPQYLLKSIEDYDEPEFGGAKYVCSPPLRDKANWPRLWSGLNTGHLQTVATDHCPFNFKGQKDMGRDNFAAIPNGVPGIETRLYLMYTAGVLGGKIGLNKMVDLIATTPAKLFGLYPDKGTVAVGADADLVVFDPAVEHTITASALHQNVDYTPYEGFKAKGAVAAVLSRGKVVAEGGKFVGQVGAGKYIVRKRFSA